ncbi:unnamed protein product [Auanema sp. JU1783]|nr:unnamed protein product [Auanema sp. JU1783]
MTTDQKPPEIEPAPFKCAVCDEPARGFHFGAFTCEGCKSFFGRTTMKKASEKFECKNNGQCDVKGSNRTSCKFCRFRTCLDVGMSPTNSRFGRRSKYFKISIASKISNKILEQICKFLTTYLVFLFILSLLPSTLAVDVFCGRLSVYEQQRFGLGSYAISSQVTTDLKQCIEICCGILNCDGVTFTGIFSARADEEPNCLLVGCRHSRAGEITCGLTDKVDDAEGLISVTLARNQSTTVAPQSIHLNLNDSLADSSAEISGSSTTYRPDLQFNAEFSTNRPYGEPHSLAPVWAVGLAIVIAVVCVGLNLSLLSAYICYRRKQSRKQTAQISTIKGPTLHAYNPAI